MYKDSLPRDVPAPSGPDCLPVQVMAHHKDQRSLRSLALVQELHSHAGEHGRVEEATQRAILLANIACMSWDGI